MMVIQGIEIAVIGLKAPRKCLDSYGPDIGPDAPDAVGSSV